MLFVDEGPLNCCPPYHTLSEISGRDDRVAHPVLVFLVFSNRISVFCKTCISCIFFLENGPPIGQKSIECISRHSKGSVRTLPQHFCNESGSVGSKNVQNWLRSDIIDVLWAPKLDSTRLLCNAVVKKVAILSFHRGDT